MKRKDLHTLCHSSWFHALPEGYITSVKIEDLSQYKNQFIVQPNRSLYHNGNCDPEEMIQIEKRRHCWVTRNRLSNLYVRVESNPRKKLKSVELHILDTAREYDTNSWVSLAETEEGISYYISPEFLVQRPENGGLLVYGNVKCFRNQDHSTPCEIVRSKGGTFYLTDEEPLARAFDQQKIAHKSMTETGNGHRFIRDLTYPILLAFPTTIKELTIFKDVTCASLLECLVSKVIDIVLSYLYSFEVSIDHCYWDAKGQLWIDSRAVNIYYYEKWKSQSNSLNFFIDIYENQLRMLMSCGIPNHYPFALFEDIQLQWKFVGVE